MQRKQFIRKTRNEIATDIAHEENHLGETNAAQIEQDDTNPFTSMAVETIQAIFDYIPDKRPLMAVSRQFRDNTLTWFSRGANQFIRQFIRNQLTLTLTDFAQCQLALRQIHAYHTYSTKPNLPIEHKIFEYSALLLALLQLMQAAPRYAKLQIALNRGFRENAFVIPIDETDNIKPLIHFSAVNDNDINTMREYISKTFPKSVATDIPTTLNELIKHASQLNTSLFESETTLAMRFIGIFKSTDPQKNIFEKQLRLCIQDICDAIGSLRKTKQLNQP